MSPFDTLKKSILAATLFLGGLSPLSTLAQNQEQLASGIKKLIFAEQHLLSRDLNEQRIMTPKANFQDDQYKPENAQIFNVKSYWLKKSNLDTFESAFISENMKALFHKKDQNGQEFFLLLVHPESESFYAEVLKDAKKGPKFWATSTASSRTLLMWPDQRPEQAFFGKLSLNKEIGGVVRTIPQGEVARSLGTNEVLFLNKKTLPKSFKFLPESFSLIPKGLARGGMIIREIPTELASGKMTFIPLFSLYANRGENRPLLAEMIAKSGMNPKDFIREKIIDPFVGQWVEMVLVHGISMEPHAQNVLIGLNHSGLPNGEFIHRDFGGFNMDIASFNKLNTMSPAKLPAINGIIEDYHQKHFQSSVNQSLETYFDQGFVYNLDQKLPEWVKKGWIPEYQESRSPQEKIFSQMIYDKIIKDLSRYTNGQVVASMGDLKNKGASRWLNQARGPMSKLKKPICSALFF